MVSKRLIHEEGHKRKFLAVVDESPECNRAVLYAGRRAAHSGGALVLLYVSEPADFQHWIGVEEIMKAEQREAGEAALEKFAQFSRDEANIDPEMILREGKKTEQLLGLIEDDRDIALLVLAAGESKEGPGPLVSSLASGANTFSIPVVVVPSDMSFEDICSVT